MRVRAYLTLGSLMLAGTALAEDGLRLSQPVVSAGELRLADKPAPLPVALRLGSEVAPVPVELRLASEPSRKAESAASGGLRLTQPLSGFQAYSDALVDGGLRLASAVPDPDLPPLTRRVRLRGHSEPASFVPEKMRPLRLQSDPAEPSGDSRGLRLAINSSLEENPRLRGSMADEGVARARVWRSVAAYAPSASGSLWVGDDPTTRVNTRSPPRTASLSVSMPVFTGGQLHYGYKSAQANSRAAQLDTLSTRDQLAADTLNAYIDMETASRQVRILRENTANLEGLAGIVGSRRKAGLAGNADVADIDAELAESRRALAGSEQAVARASETIRGLLGRTLPAGSPLPDLERVASHGKPALLEMSKQRNPGVQSSWNRYAAADYNSRAAVGKYLPRLDVSADYRSYRNYRTSSAAEGWTVGMTLKVPLVDMTTMADIRETREAASAAYYRAVDRHREVETRISQSWEEFSGSGARLALSGRKAGALRAALASRMEQFRIGVLPVDDVLAQNRKLANARIEEIEARMQRQMALVRLAADAGLLQDILRQ